MKNEIISHLMRRNIYSELDVEFELYPNIPHIRTHYFSAGLKGGNHA